MFESGADVSDGCVGEEDGVGHGQLEEVRAAQHEVGHVVIRQRVAAAGQVQLMARNLNILLSGMQLNMKLLYMYPQSMF